MTRNSRKYLLLFLILAFAFSYRVMLMLLGGFPPGADIGLHNSVINSITQSGNVDFLYNDYQMGGGLSLTFPGYHILVAQVVLFTGMPDVLAHTLVVALFSTLIVACAFLITRRLWMESTAFIVAFLVAVSRFDIEMLMWGGYPNVVTLMLIPLIVYLILESKRFSLPTFLISASLLTGALFLTHSLSALVFGSTILVVVVFAAVFSKQIELPRKRLLFWLAPLVLGAVVVSPFLINAVPAYLGANAETFTGGVTDIRDALLSTRILPWQLLVPLAVCVFFAFLFSRAYKGKYLTVSSLLVALGVWVPVAFTQGYFVGFYIDYNRFLYFLILPVLILVGMAIEHVVTVSARVTDVYVAATRETWQKNKTALRLGPNLKRKNYYAGYLLAALLFSFFVFGLFLTPWEGNTVQSFYQVMTNPGYEAMQWVKQNTPQDSVFVSDALYGWWLSGFAERKTLSAVDPQYLTLEREFAPATVAKDLLDTDYVIDNGLIQIREDGGYVARHNPMFLADINWSYFPYPFFNFKNDETTITATQGGNVTAYDLTQLQVTDQHMTNTSDWAAIYVSKGNSLFTYTQIVTVYKGLQFVNMTITLQPNAPDVTFSQAVFTIQSKGESIDYNNTVGFYDAGGKVLGQLIFTQGQPIFHEDGPSMIYTLANKPAVKLELWGSAFSVDDELQTLDEPATAAAIGTLMANNAASYQQPTSSQRAKPVLDFFDYKQAMVDWNVSYVAVRDPGVMMKFIGDPAFSLLFINNEVAIFVVK
jgi:hypothetical protein